MRSPQEKLNVTVAAVFFALLGIIAGALTFRLVRWIIGF